MTYEQFLSHFEEYVLSNPGCQAYFARSTAVPEGANDVKVVLAANDLFSCAAMLMATFDSLIATAENIGNFEAEMRFTAIKGAAAQILEMDMDHPSETIHSEKEQRS